MMVLTGSNLSSPSCSGPDRVGRTRQKGAVFSPLNENTSKLCGQRCRRQQRHTRRISAQSTVIDSQKAHDVDTYFTKLKWDQAGLVPVIVQDIVNGSILMQAYSDKAGILETLNTGLATFYSRSRAGRWCKGETSNNYIRVTRVLMDCDSDSLIYLGKPDGPACHTGAQTCYFKELKLEQGQLVEKSAEPGGNLSPSW